MQTLTESVAQMYCKNCYLATPTWRVKCIHCGLMASMFSPFRSGGRRHPQESRRRNSPRIKFSR
jgi:hypothetical protein